MKKYLFLILSVLALFSFAAVSHAADTAAPAASSGITADNVVQWLTPVIVPLVLAGMKKAIPIMPTWLIPVLAPFLGMAVDLLNSLATAHSSSLLTAALLGLAGVGVREVKDQLTPPPKPAV